MTWWSSIRSMPACAMAVIVTCNFIAGVRGETIRLNWTSEGVRQYISTPLQTELGDVLELDCKDNVSNLYIQADQIQYDSCNASAGSGVFKFNGFCFPGNSMLLLTLTQNSKKLENTINFENNQIYYLTSYSDGELGNSGERGSTSGGQCEDGLKMIIIIGEAPTSGLGGSGGGNPHNPVPSEQGQVSTGNRSGGSNTTLYIIIGAATGGGLLLVGLCIVLIIITTVCIIKGHRSKEVKTTTYYGNSPYYINNNNNKGTDSQTCTLTRLDYNVEPQPVIKFSTHETPVTALPQTNDEVNTEPLTTFGGNKSLGSADFLNVNSHYRSEKSFDDATGQLSTPFHANTTPEHLLKAKSLNSLPGTLPMVKPRPIPPKKPRQQDMYKSSSADNLLSR